MNKLKFRFLFPTCILLIPPNFQVFSQNQSSNHFIINKKEQQAIFAFLLLVKEELPNREYKVEFNASSLHSLHSEVNNYFLTEIYLNKKSIYEVIEN